jgi:enamine deaminase RidA (YjgF/YER057c/UK114 family)
MLKHLNPKAMMKSVPAYSHGVVIPAGSRVLYVAGQVAGRADGSVPADPKEQCELAWANVVAVLAEAGMSPADLVKVNTYVTSTDIIPHVREVRGRIVTQPPPASTLVVVPALASPQWLVEIEAVAAQQPKPKPEAKPPRLRARRAATRRPARRRPA